VRDACGRTRLHFYDFIRTYALARLERRPDRARIEGRHAQYFLAWGQQWAEAAESRESPEAITRLAVERDNLAAAHDRAADASVRARVALILDPLLQIRGPRSVHAELLDTALDDLEPDASPRLRCRLLSARSALRRWSGQPEGALGDAERALAVAEEVSDPALVGRARIAAAYAHQHLGRVSEALAVLEEATREGGPGSPHVAIAHLLQGHLLYASGDLRGAARALGPAIAAARDAGAGRTEGAAELLLGVLLHEQARDGEAEHHWERAQSCYDAHGDRWDRAVFATNLAGYAFDRGELDRATSLLEDALETHRELGRRPFEAFALELLGRIELERGDLEASRRHHERAIDIHRSIGDERRLAIARVRLAQLRWLRGPARGVRRSLRHLRDLPLRWARRDALRGPGSERVRRLRAAVAPTRRSLWVRHGRLRRRGGHDLRRSRVQRVRGLLHAPRDPVGGLRRLRHLALRRHRRDVV